MLYNGHEKRNGGRPSRTAWFKGSVRRFSGSIPGTFGKISNKSVPEKSYNFQWTSIVFLPSCNQEHWNKHQRSKINSKFSTITFLAWNREHQAKKHTVTNIFILWKMAKDRDYNGGHKNFTSVNKTLVFNIINLPKLTLTIGSSQCACARNIKQCRNSIFGLNWFLTYGTQKTLSNLTSNNDFYT